MFVKGRSPPNPSGLTCSLLRSGALEQGRPPVTRTGRFGASRRPRGPGPQWESGVLGTGESMGLYPGNRGVRQVVGCRERLGDDTRRVLL